MLAQLMPPVAAPPALPVAAPSSPATPDAPAAQGFARLLDAAHAAKTSGHADQAEPGSPPRHAAPVAHATAEATHDAGPAAAAAAPTDPSDASAEIAADAAVPDAAALLATLAGVPQPQPAPWVPASPEVRAASDTTTAPASAGSGRVRGAARALAESIALPAAEDSTAKAVATRADIGVAQPDALPVSALPAPTAKPTPGGTDSASAQTWHQEWQAAAGERVAEPTAAPAGLAPAMAATPVQGSPITGAMPTPAAPADAAAPSCTLSAHAQSAAFGPELGARITTFVRAGVEHARLELHPAEMGPVSVRIELDGSTAQVHLGAEHAATRQVLEQAMPLLAGSLREAGLTLTGGGVFEQPRQSQPGTPEATPSAARGARERDDALLPAASTTVLRPRGVVDLVA